MQVPQNNGEWFSIEDKVVTINADTYENWLENDGFYGSLYKFVKMHQGPPVVMKIIGSDESQGKVLVRISKLAKNLQFDSPGSLEIKVVTNVPPWEEPEVIAVNIVDEVKMASEISTGEFPEVIEEQKPEIVTPKKRKK